MLLNSNFPYFLQTFDSLEFALRIIFQQKSKMLNLKYILQIFSSDRQKKMVEGYLPKHWQRFVVITFEKALT